MGLDNFDKMMLVALSQYQDIHLPVSQVKNTVLFPGRLRAKEDLWGVLDQLGKLILERAPGTDGRSFMIDLEVVRYRVTPIRENELYALRLSRAHAPTFDKDVKFAQNIGQALVGEDLRTGGGLVLVSGVPGSGKTWTVLSTIKERLVRYGGYCLTIEDPIEMMMEGWHGENGGYCEQMDATENGYRKSVATSLRCFPSGERAMLFIGEIREPEPAAEMLRIARSGHLVFTTVHADDHIAACQRIVSLARDGGEPGAQRLLANSLKLSLNQRLDGTKMQASLVRSSAAIAGCIEREDYSQFKQITDTQHKLAIGAPSAPLRMG